MKGIVVTTIHTMYVKDFGEPLYKTLGKEVGGHIEVVHPRELKAPLTMIVNEEERPEMVEFEKGHYAACHRINERGKA